LTPIFNYGNSPFVGYNTITKELQVLTRNKFNDNEIIFKSNKIPVQRWNNFIFNYDGGKIDIFLNGELVSTKSGIIPYMKFQNAVVGSKKGVKGGICNIIHFPEPLTKLRIDWLYNTLKTNYPPTI
jgi:hypothetical protein